MEFEVEFKRLYRPLCLYALQYTQQTDEAEDIVQQAFADVWEKLHAGELIANLKAYLYQAVKNRSIHFAARKREEILTDFRIRPTRSESPLPNVTPASGLPSTGFLLSGAGFSSFRSATG